MAIILSRDKTNVDLLLIGPKFEKNICIKIEELSFEKMFRNCRRHNGDQLSRPRVF